MSNYHLTTQQLEQFQEDGYLILPSLFNAEEVGRMRQEADRILGLILNSSIALNRISGRLDWMMGQSKLPVVRKIQPINDLSDYLTQVSNDPRLLDPMRDIMQDEPVLMEEKLNYKQPLRAVVEGVPITDARDDRFPIHNDWAYYKAQNYPQEIISSAIAMDDSTTANGPLRVWPGSHRAHLEHEAMELGLQVLPGSVDFNGGIDILAPAGSVMFFHTLLVHNSRPNTTDGPRRLMIYSHYPARFDLGDDARNGPARRHEQPYERQYCDLVQQGAYQDQFKA